MSLMDLRCYGHPAIRATHAKTLEFTADSAVTERATCVVGVGATVVGGSVAGVAGPILIRLSAGGESAVLRAVGNPRWQPGGPMIVRRSGNRLPDTLATDAELGAAQLPRALAARLADPEAVLEVSIERDQNAKRATAVLMFATQADQRLELEAAAADLAVAEDDNARKLLAGYGMNAVKPSDVDVARAAIDQGQRLLVLASDDLPGTALPWPLADPEAVALEVIGLPPALAVGIASPSRAPLVLAGQGNQGNHRRATQDLLRSTPLDARLVLRLPATALDKVLDTASRTRGTQTAAVAPDPYWTSERPVRGPLELVRGAAPTRGDLVCCLDPAPVPDTGLDPALARLLTALLAKGVQPSTLAHGLAELPDWSRREAYQAVADLK